MKATKPTNVRWQRTPVRNEASWIPRTLEDLELVRERLATAGQTAPVINGITGWLAAKALGDHTSASGDTAARYRKILGELGTGPNPNGDRRLRDAGEVDDGTLVGVGLVGVAGMAMALGRPAAAAAAVIVLAAHNARDESYDAFELGAAA